MKKQERYKLLKRACKLVQHMVLAGYGMKDPNFLNSYGALQFVIDTVNSLKKLPEGFLETEFYDLEIDAECDVEGGKYYADVVDSINRFLEFTSSEAAKTLFCEFYLTDKQEAQYASFVKEVNKTK